MSVCTYLDIYILFFNILPVTTTAYMYIYRRVVVTGKISKNNSGNVIIFIKRKCLSVHILTYIYYSLIFCMLLPLPCIYTYRQW